MSSSDLKLSCGRWIRSIGSIAIPIAYTSIVQNTRPGSIILAHNIHATTIAAMPSTLDALLAKGYKSVTVSELIAMEIPPQLVKKDPAAAIARPQ